MKTIIVISISSFLLGIALINESYEFYFPSHFPVPVYELEANPLKRETIQLGRALFYDPILSADSSISCASCHSPYNGFAHSDHALSHGIHDSIGNRNAPALFNLAWASSFNWDGGVNHLDMQALAPIEDVREMNQDFGEVVLKLKENPIYIKLFTEAYGENSITGEHLLKALAQFQLTLVSANSKYDQKIKGNILFTEQEIRGEKLFLKHCNNCHTAPLFSNYSFQSNGLELDLTLHDLGKYEITKDSADIRKFKVPSLRNLSYTYPYMHDGRFRNLREVINHYTSLSDSENPLSKELKGGMLLTEIEKTDLIAFLLTLDDKEFIFNPNNKFPRNILLNP